MIQAPAARVRGKRAPNGWELPDKLDLKNCRFLSYDRPAQAFADLFCIPLSVGMLARIDQSCARWVEGVVEQIRQKLIRARVVHFDETGLNINGELYWLYGAGTQGFT